MTHPRSLLDTDILSAVLRVNPAVTTRAGECLAEHGVFAFSIITRYEVLRGLKAKNATAQIQAFERFCGSRQILPLTDDVVVRAADIYADLKQRGEPIGDADTLISATATVNGLAVVTNNESHFRRGSRLHVENWLKQ